jgi:hypothetical protein
MLFPHAQRRLEHGIAAFNSVGMGFAATYSSFEQLTVSCSKSSISAINFLPMASSVISLALWLTFWRMCGRRSPDRTPSTWKLWADPPHSLRGKDDALVHPCGFVLLHAINASDEGFVGFHDFAAAPSRVRWERNQAVAADAFLAGSHQQDRL